MTKRKPTLSGGIALVALGAALWGTDAIFRRGLALELPATTLVFLEHVVLVALTAPVLWRSRDQYRQLQRGDWIAVLAIGAGASALATVMFTAAFRYGDPTTPLLLQKVQPLIAIGAAALILGERLLPRFAWFLVGGLAGAYLVAFADPSTVSVSALTPALLALGAAVFWGLGTVLGRHLMSKISFTALTALRFAVALPVLGVVLVTLPDDSMLSAVSLGDMGGVVLLAFVPGLVALLLYYQGLRSTPASAATLAELAFPLSAVGLNYIVFDTVLTLTQWVGVIVLAATITTMTWLSQRSRETGIGVRIPEPVLSEA
ncbi:MAG TPA: DMT family transporter [Acidimicrobiia bacterium]